MSAPEKTLNIAISTKHQAAIHGLGKVTEYTERLVGKVVRLRAVTQQLGGRMTKTTERFNETGKSIGVTTDKVKQLNRGLFKTGDSFGKIIMKVTQWTVATGILFGSVRALKGGLDTIVDIDDKMVMLNKVFQGTKDQLAGVRSETMRLSVEMGNLVGASVDAATEWAKMGRVGSELSSGLRVSLLAQNIAEIDSADASKLLNAAMLQFNIGMEESIGILDEWNELSNRTPVTTRDLAASVQQAGAIFNSAGADIQDLNAYTAALSASMAKSGKEIGSAMKTIGSYIRRQSSVKKILDITGISLERQDGQLMELDDAILQLANSWRTLTDIEKEEIAQTAAGVRRKAFFINLMENFNLVLENYAIQWEAAGSAIEENEIRMASLKTKLQQLSAAIENMAIKTGDKGLLGLMKKTVDAAREQIDAFGEMGGAMQFTEIAIGAMTAKLAFSVVAMKKMAVSIATVKAGLYSLIAVFAKIAVVIGIIWIAGEAINTLNEIILKEELALKRLNEERRKRIKLLGDEIGKMRAAQLQYKVFNSLVTTFKDISAAGGDTTEVMEQIAQIWEAIDSANPGLLAGLETMGEVFIVLGERAEGLDEKIKKVVSEKKFENIEIQVSLSIEEASFKKELDEFVKKNMTVTDYDVPEEFGRQVKNDVAIKAFEGDPESALKLLNAFKKGLEDTGGEEAMIVKVNEAIEVITKLGTKTKDIADIMEGLNEAFNSTAWSDMVKDVDRVTKSIDRLKERSDRRKNKTKSSSQMYEDIFGEPGDKAKIKTTFAEIEAYIAKYQAILDLLGADNAVKSNVNTDSYNAIVGLLEKVTPTYEKMLDVMDKVDKEEAAMVAAEARRQKEISKLGKEALAEVLAKEKRELKASEDRQKLTDKLAEEGIRKVRDREKRKLSDEIDAEDARNKISDREIRRATKVMEDLEKFRNKDKTSSTMFEELFGMAPSDDSIENALNAYGKRSLEIGKELSDSKRSDSELTEKEIQDLQVYLAEINDIYVQLWPIFQKLNEERRIAAHEDERSANALERQLIAAEKAAERKALSIQRGKEKTLGLSGRETKREARIVEGLRVRTARDLGDAIGAATEHGFGGDRALGALHNFTTSLGDMLENSIGTSVTKSLAATGAWASPLGALAGAVGGSLIDILADSLFGEKSQSDKLIDEMDRNTLALQDNTNAFRDFQERLINAPSTFALPALAGDSTSGYGGGDTVDFISKGIGGSGGGNTSTTLTIEGGINIDGSKSPIATGKAVVAAIDKAYSNSDDRGKNLAQDF